MSNTNRRLDTDSFVLFYENDFYPLSNFSSFRVTYETIDFDTAEHAYHWMKFRASHWLVKDQIEEARSAHDAYKIAQSYRSYRREDWDDVKLDIMRRIIRAKAEQHEYVRRKLLATGDRILVEDSWRDDFWGWGENKRGLNWLGRLWMELRAELRGVTPVRQAAIDRVRASDIFPAPAAEPVGKKRYLQKCTVCQVISSANLEDGICLNCTLAMEEQAAGDRDRE